MTTEGPPRRSKAALLALLVLGVAAALWLPRWWENRLYRQAERIGGVGAAMLPGSLTEARRKIDPGMSTDKVVAAIGRPSIGVHTDGSSTHDLWTYYYENGTMIVHFTDGVIVRASVDYHPPLIPTSARR